MDNPLQTPAAAIVRKIEQMRRRLLLEWAERFLFQTIGHDLPLLFNPKPEEEDLRLTPCLDVDPPAMEPAELRKMLGPATDGAAEADGQRRALFDREGGFFYFEGE